MLEEGPSARAGPVVLVPELRQPGGASRRPCGQWLSTKRAVGGTTKGRAIPEMQPRGSLSACDRLRRRPWGLLAPAELLGEKGVIVANGGF